MNGNTRLLLLLMLGAVAVGCGDSTPGTAPLTAREAYWGLRLNYHAINLAIAPPYNTVRLVATPLNAEGDVIPDIGPVKFATVDSAIRVDSTGTVVAQYRTNSNVAYVIASLQYQNLTLADTVAVQVTQAAPSERLATFSLQPQIGYHSSCSLSVFGGFLDTCGSLRVSATDSAGGIVSNSGTSSIVIAYTSSNPLIALVDQKGKITAVDTGHVTFTASTWAYGIVMRDSLQYVIDWPQYQQMNIVLAVPPNGLTAVPTFEEPVVTLGVGGTLAWLNLEAPPLDIVFDDSVDVDSGCIQLDCSAAPTTGVGNVPSYYLDPAYTGFGIGYAARSFPVAGTYHYHSSLYPSSTGVVYVREHLFQ
jgi:hypothetical protein